MNHMGVGERVSRDGVLVRFGEIGIKSAPVRRAMVERLRQNLMDGLERSATEGDVVHLGSRLWMAGPDTEALARVAVHTFGVVSASPATRVAATMEAMEPACAAAALARPGWSSFAVRASREGRHAFSSQDIGVWCGAAIHRAASQQGRTPRVDLDRPELEVWVDVRGADAYVFVDRLEGPGGLPVGTQGTVVAILDGPHAAAAAWLMMRRGCSVVGILPQGADAGTGGAGPAPLGWASLAAWGLRDVVVPEPGVSLHVAAADVARQRRATAIATGETLAAGALPPPSTGADGAGPAALRPVYGLAPAVLARIERRIAEPGGVRA